jgi:membrane protein
LLVAWFGIWTAGQTLIALALNKLNYTPQFDGFATLLRWLVTLLMFGASVYLINHFLPPRPRAKHKLTPGTILSVLCLSVITGAFNLYMRHTSEISQIYGALTGFIVMMLWIYLASFSLILGAETDTAVNDLAPATRTNACGAPSRQIAPPAAPWPWRLPLRDFSPERLFPVPAAACSNML